MKWKLYEGPVDESGRRTRPGAPTGAKATPNEPEHGNWHSTIGGNASAEYDTRQASPKWRSGRGGGHTFTSAMGSADGRAHPVYEARPAPQPASSGRRSKVPKWMYEDYPDVECANCKPKQKPEPQQDSGWFANLQGLYRAMHREDAREAAKQEAPKFSKASAKADFESFWSKWKGNDTSTIRRAGAVHFPGFTRNEPHAQEVMTLINSRCDEIERANRRR